MLSLLPLLFHPDIFAIRIREMDTALGTLPELKVLGLPRTFGQLAI